MKVKLRWNSKLPKLLGVDAITLYPYIFFKDSPNELGSSILVRHEMEHVRQVRKLGWFKFYSSYLVDIVIGLFKYGNYGEAYEANKYEVEAYGRQTTPLTKAEIEELGNWRG